MGVAVLHIGRGVVVIGRHDEQSCGGDRWRGEKGVTDSWIKVRGLARTEGGVRVSRT